MYLVKKIVSFYYFLVDLDGLGVTFSFRDPRFAGSNPAEVDGYFFRTLISWVLREGL